MLTGEAELGSLLKSRQQKEAVLKDYLYFHSIETGKSGTIYPASTIIDLIVQSLPTLFLNDTSSGKPNGEITCRPRDKQIKERGYFRSGLLTGYVSFKTGNNIMRLTLRLQELFSTHRKLFHIDYISG